MRVVADLVTDLMFVIRIKNVKVYASKPLESSVSRTNQTIEMRLERAVPLCGDIKVEFYHKQPLSKVLCLC
jgi:hypothetical protein